MAGKRDMKNIFFLFLILLTINGCATPRPHSVRIIFGGNIQGKITRMEEGSTAGVYGTLARVGGLIDRQVADTRMPTVMFQTGNTINITGESQVVKAKLLAEGARMIGFAANLPASLEFKDTPEFARVRDSWGWPEVLSNVKPKAGVEPPVNYPPYYRCEPQKGWFVYLLNFVDSLTFNKSELLSKNYEYVQPSDFIKSFIRSIRTTDMVVVHFQASALNDLTVFFNKQESEDVDLIIVPHPIYLNINQDMRRSETFKNINLMAEPANVSNIQEAILTWDNLREKWKLEQHQLQASLNYPEHEGVRKLLESNDKSLRDLVRMESYVERVQSFIPPEGTSRSKWTSEQCSRCHPSAFEVWKKTRHSSQNPKIVCDDCHNASDPHMNFEDWLLTISPDNQKIFLDKYPNRLVGKIPTRDDCAKCHTGSFDFESSWLKIKHSVEKVKVEPQKQETIPAGNANPDKTGKKDKKK